jgi:hypothetical protein
VFAKDFTVDGFHSTGKLVRAARNPKAAPLSLPDTEPEVRGLDLARLHGFTLIDLLAIAKLDRAYVERRSIQERLDSKQTRQLQESVATPGRLLPGLLILPSREYWIPHPTHAHRFVVAELLFNRAMLRVYGEGRDPYDQAECFLFKPEQEIEVVHMLDSVSVPVS